jgi:hypothetical protein
VDLEWGKVAWGFACFNCVLNHLFLRAKYNSIGKWGPSFVVNEYTHLVAYCFCLEFCGAYECLKVIVACFEVIVFYIRVLQNHRIFNKLML